MSVQTWAPSKKPKASQKPTATHIRFDNNGAVAAPSTAEIDPDDLSNYVAIDVEHTPVVEGGSWPTQVSIVDGNLKTLLN